MKTLLQISLKGGENVDSLPMTLFLGIFPTLQCKKAAFTVASIQCTNSCNLSKSLSTTTIGKTNITGTATNAGDIYLLLPSSFLNIV